MWMGVIVLCHTARAIPDTINGRMFSLLPHATQAHQPCRPAEVAFH